MSTAPSPTSTASAKPHLLVTAAVVALVVVLAQLAEAAVLHADPRHDHLVGPLYLDLTYNRGSSFSMMSGGGWLPVLLSVLVVAVMAVLVWRADRWSVAVGGAMALGGGISNLVDRAHHGAVADYLWTSFWPTFNVADAAITVGIATLVGGLVLGGRERGRA